MSKLGGGGGGGGSWGGKGKHNSGGGSEVLEGLLLKLSEELSKVKGTRWTEGGDREQVPQAMAKLFASKQGLGVWR